MNLFSNNVQKVGQLIWYALLILVAIVIWTDIILFGSGREAILSDNNNLIFIIELVLLFFLVLYGLAILINYFNKKVRHLSILLAVVFIFGLIISISAYGYFSLLEKSEKEAIEVFSHIKKYPQLYNFKMDNKIRIDVKDILTRAKIIKLKYSSHKHKSFTFLVMAENNVSFYFLLKVKNRKINDIIHIHLAED